uniref:SMC family ATPase n=1 Tax=Thermofilum pendens TaxID=2269 RepID=A0A7C3WWB3_THEPE
MVRIVSLKAENFRRLNLQEPVQFPNGLVVIRGRNEAGKSTILEAVLFGLYGDFRIPAALRGGRQGLESLVNYRAGRARVEVVFETGGRRYRVERIIEAEREGARQVDARLVELSDSGARLLAAGVTKVNEEVQRLLRVSWREMLATNVIAQKDLERIVKMERSDRERIINMMMGFESYNKAVEKLTEEAKELRSKLETSGKELEMVASRLQELEEKGRKLSEWKSELKQLEERLPHLEREVGKEEAACSYLRELEASLARRNGIRLQLEGVRGEKSRVQSRVEEVKRSLDAAARELSDLRGKLEELEPRLVAAEEELRRAEEELGRVLSVQARAEELYKSYREASRELEELRRREASLRERLSSEERLRAERSSALEELSEVERAARSARVPAWSLAGAVLTAAASIALAAVNLLALVGLAVATLLLLMGLQARDRLVHELMRKASDLRERVSRLEAELRELERDREELEELSRREKALVGRLEEVESQLGGVAAEVGLGGEFELVVSRLSELVAEAKARRDEAQRVRDELQREQSSLSATLRGRESEVERLRGELERLSKELSELDARERSLEKELLSVRVPEPPFEVEGLGWPLADEDVQRVSELRARREERLRALRGELGEVRGRAEELRERVEEVERELQELPSLKAKLEELRETVRKLGLEVQAREAAVIALREVSRKRREVFAPSVERNMSWLVSYITDGRYKAVRIDPQTYDVEVFDAEAGRWMRRDIYSGGTNDQFLLAMRIAFTLSLLPAAKGAYPRFLFLDEPLGSSDQERRERIVELLASELTRFFDQVFLVTHVEVEEPPGSTVVVVENGSIQRVYRVGPSEA